MDADDVAHPERLAAQRSRLAGDPGLAGCGTRVEYFPRDSLGSGARRYEGWLNAVQSPEELRRELFVECPIAHPTLVIRAAALHGLGGYRDVGWPEDYDLILRAAVAGLELANLSLTGLAWRVSDERLSLRSAAYSPDAFRRCKAHFLVRHFLPAGRELAVWGAGKVGKPFALALAAEGRAIDAFVDLDPRKIGQEIHGAPVIEPAALLERRPRPYALIAVGSPGARGEIRHELCGSDWQELEDFRTVA